VLEDLLDLGADLVTRVRSVDARHRQVVGFGITVTSSRYHGERDRRACTGIPVEAPAACASAVAA
jgi:hypothetical protein